MNAFLNTPLGSDPAVMYVLKCVCFVLQSFARDSVHYMYQGSLLTVEINVN